MSKTKHNSILEWCHSNPIKITSILIAVMFLIWLMFSYYFSRIDEIRWLSCLFGKISNLEGVFAASASFFTVITFAALIITLIQQQKGIINNSKGYKITSFESIFFNLLEIHSTNQSEINLSSSSKRSGAPFNSLYNAVVTAYKFQEEDIDILNDQISKHKQSEKQRLVNLINKDKNHPDYFMKHFSLALDIRNQRVHNANTSNMLFFDAIQNKYGEHVTKYYRHLFHTLKHIEKAKDDGIISDVSHYCNILKAQLTPKEQVLLFYNGLYFDEIREKDGYKKLLTKFSLFDDLDRSLLFCSGKLGKYPQKAFGSDYKKFSEYIEEAKDD
ncbi:putative phage abortive infection protein [Maridesulfovibrio sp.]|uniref:putative phage abortive infection protein n=1 Tax=unclassified Maridesulfovibrio TaxID=2794999 RepID=UPI003AFF9039